MKSLKFMKIVGLFGPFILLMVVVAPFLLVKDLLVSICKRYIHKVANNIKRKGRVFPLQGFH